MRFITHYAVEKVMMFDVLGLLLGFVTLLSGSALGFLISQFWHVIYNYILKIYCILERRPHYAFLIKNFEQYREKDKLLSLMNYFIISLIKDQRMSDYITRRSDLFNTLGSTGISLFIGSLSGFVIKTYILKNPATRGTYINWCNYEIFIFLSSLVIMIIIFLNMLRIWRETDTMVEVLINFSNEDKGKLNSLLGMYNVDEVEKT